MGFDFYCFVVGDMFLWGRDAFVFRMDCLMFFLPGGGGVGRF